MSRERNAHINERLHTGLANSGRAAGSGISYDRYDEESGPGIYAHTSGGVKFPSDSLTPDEIDALNGPVKIIRPANKAKEEL